MTGPRCGACGRPDEAVVLARCTTLEAVQGAWNEEREVFDVTGQDCIEVLSNHTYLWCRRCRAETDIELR